MSANIDFSTGVVRKLDRVAGSETPLTERDVEDPSVLVRLFTRILREVAKAAGRWTPRRIDFANVTLDATGTSQVRLTHMFGGEVRYWVVGWNGAAAPNVRKHTDSTTDVLLLTSTSAGTATVRVEEAG